MTEKITLNIKRTEAIGLLAQEIFPFKEKTNKNLEEMLESYGFGEDSELEHYGNILIVDDD